MSAGAKAIIAATVAAPVIGVIALALERNLWLAVATGGLAGALVFFGTYSYYAELARSTSPDEQRPSRWVLPFTSDWRTRRLVDAGKLGEAGRRLVAAGDWAGARRLIATYVRIRQVREPLVNLLKASRSLEEMQATLPAETPEAFKTLARETVFDVSHRLWARTQFLARLSNVPIPAAAEADVAAEARRIEEFAQQVEDTATDLLRLSLAGYDARGIRQGTELLTAIRRKADVLLAVAADDLGSTVLAED